MTEFDNMVNSDRWGEAIQTEHNRLEMSNTSGGSQSECKSLSSLVTPLPGTVKKQPTVETSTVMSGPTFGAESSNEDNAQEESLPPSSYLPRTRMFGLLCQILTEQGLLLPLTVHPTHKRMNLLQEETTCTQPQDMILDHESAWSTGEQME